MAMLSSSCSDSFLSCKTERRLSSNGRFPKAVRNKRAGQGSDAQILKVRQVPMGCKRFVEIYSYFLPSSFFIGHRGN